MNVARPIRKEEYEAFRKEIYELKDGAEGRLKMAVALDSDPTMRPKNLSAKLAEVQAHKDRMVVILNRAVLAEAYWKTLLEKVQSYHESMQKGAMCKEEVRAAKSSDLRESAAEQSADKDTIDHFFKGEGAYVEHRSTIVRNLADASAFKTETHNIYSNLDDASRNLAVQLKSVMVSAKVYGDPSEEEQTDQRMKVGG